MEIQPLYKSILASLNIISDDAGLLSFHYNGSSFPVKVGDKRLALPTPALLREGAFGQHAALIAFHPLSENIVRGESEVLRKTKAAVVLRLTQIIANLAGQFLELGADTSRHASLPPDVQEMLAGLAEVDEKSVAQWEKIVAATKPDGPNRLFSMYLARGAKYKGEKYNRVAVVSLPIMEEFERGDGYVFGVGKLRKKDQLAFQALMNYILPNADETEAYSAPTHDRTAPYFDALLRAYYNVARRLNDVVRIHRKHLVDPDELVVDLGWYADISDLTVYRGLIPPLYGNEGELIGESSVAPEARPIPAVAVPSTPVPQQRPVVAPEEPASSGVFNTDLRTLREVPQPAAQPAPRRPGQGKDFNSILAAQRQSHAPPFVPTNHVAPGDYANSYRGQPVSAFSSFGQQQNQAQLNMANMPSWMGPGNQQTVGFGQQPAFGRGGYNTNAGGGFFGGGAGGGFGGGSL